MKSVLHELFNTVEITNGSHSRGQLWEKEQQTFSVSMENMRNLGSEADDSGWEDDDDNENYFSDEILFVRIGRITRFLINTNQAQICNNRIMFISLIHKLFG